MSSTTGPIRSLAVTVRFQHPGFGMEGQEVLSRASSFLLSVDPLWYNDKDTYGDDVPKSKFDHLRQRKKEDAEREFRKGYLLEPAGGPSGRKPKELRWLEFCPIRHRPKVHCVASSHVLAPWRWKQYYPQDWVTHVKPEHCSYSLEVMPFNNTTSAMEEAQTSLSPVEPLAEFPLNPFPIHHPGGLDLAIIHLQEEEEALSTMKKLGVNILDTRDLEKDQPIKGESLDFAGFKIADADLSEKDDDFFNKNNKQETSIKDDYNNDKPNDDNRVFIPYTTTGELLFGSADRFIASTPFPLPQGLCGGPVIDSHNLVAGVIEGIVPLNHEDPKLAGNAAYIPSIKLREFLDTYAEPLMLEEIMPTDLYDKAVRLKNGEDLLDPEQKVPVEEKERKVNQSKGDNDIDLDGMYNSILQTIRKNNDPAASEAFISSMTKETEQVIDILNREGGDVDEIIAHVRAKHNGEKMSEEEETK